jgi:hypothetical protein
MSYILDSLKKSDQERKRGSVPGLLSDHGGNGPDPRPLRRRRWPFLLVGGILLLNGVILAVWLQPWRTKEQPAADIPAATAPAVARQVMKGDDAHRRVPAIADPAHDALVMAAAEAAEGNRPPARRAAAGNEVSPISHARLAPAKAQTGNSRRVRMVHGEDSDNAEREARAAFGKDHSPRRPGTGVSQEAGPVENETKYASSAETGQGPAAEPHHAKSPEEAAPEESAPEQGLSGSEESKSTPSESSSEQKSEEPVQPKIGQPEKPPTLDRMPASAREGLPEIHISAHYYTKNPASRLVSVDGTILREGQEMEDGLKVEEIKPDGVIFKYRGKKFFVNVFQQ